MSANPVRGETALRVNGETLVLRPSFAALVAAEGELGPLFALVDDLDRGRQLVGIHPDDDVLHVLLPPVRSVVDGEVGIATTSRAVPS